MKPIKIVLSCEHAVSSIPAKYQPYFKDHKDLLNTHRAIDFGALEIAENLSQALKLPLISASWSRIFIECNRSLNHKQLFSEVLINLPTKEKQEIIDLYYHPYRQKVIKTIEETIAKGNLVLHLSMHSFVPVLHGITRTADIGLLYDPKRAAEKTFVKNFQLALREKSNYRVRRNYPYAGIADGFTTYLRKMFSNEDYAGIEIEVNQALTRVPSSLNSVSKLLIESLSDFI